MCSFMVFAVSSDREIERQDGGRAVDISLATHQEDEFLPGGGGGGDTQYMDNLLT